MDEKDIEKLTDIAIKLNSLISVLCGYCENFSEMSNEMSDLFDFSNILKNTVKELYDLL